MSQIKVVSHKLEVNVYPGLSNGIYSASYSNHYKILLNSGDLSIHHEIADTKSVLYDEEHSINFVKGYDFCEKDFFKTFDVKSIEKCGESISFYLGGLSFRSLKDKICLHGLNLSNTIKDSQEFRNHLVTLVNRIKEDYIKGISAMGLKLLNNYSENNKQLELFYKYKNISQEFKNAYEEKFMKEEKLKNRIKELEEQVKSEKTEEFQTSVQHESDLREKYERSIRVTLKQELTPEVKVQLRKELRDEIYSELLIELERDARKEIEDKLRDELSSQFYAEFSENKELLEEVRKDMKDELYEQEYEDCRDEMYQDACDSVAETIKARILEVL